MFEYLLAAGLIIGVMSMFVLFMKMVVIGDDGLEDMETEV